MGNVVCTCQNCGYKFDGINLELKKGSDLIGVSKEENVCICGKLAETNTILIFSGDYKGHSCNNWIPINRIEEYEE